MIHIDNLGMDTRLYGEHLRMATRLHRDNLGTATRLYRENLRMANSTIGNPCILALLQQLLC